jgi:hypothetical protein
VKGGVPLRAEKRRARARALLDALVASFFFPLPPFPPPWSFALPFAV